MPGRRGWWIGIAGLFLGTATTAQQAPRILVSPEAPLLDEDIQIRLVALSANRPAVLRAEAEDARGLLWQSWAVFDVSSAGEVDLSRQAPAGGSYAGVDPMGLFWSMDVAGEQHGRANFHVSGADPIRTLLRLEIGDDEVARLEFERLPRAPAVRRKPVRENGLHGELFEPGEAGPFPGVIVLGGSEGGMDALTPGLLASHGFVALSLAYFSLHPMGTLPRNLEEIPLEYFGKAVDWLSNQASVSGKPIGIMGGSKGAEAALLAASRYDAIAAVVAYAPSAVAWEGPFSTEPKSSWSYRGKPVPFAAYHRKPTYRPLPGFPVNLVEHYRYSFERQRDESSRFIPVERIRGAIFLISGRDDRILPSTLMAEAVMERLEAANFLYPHFHLAYENAGHHIGTACLPTTWIPGAARRWPSGGTPEGSAKAQADSWPKVLRFLDEQLASPSEP